MRVALRRAYLRAAHEERAVLLLMHAAAVDRAREARPAGAGVELVERAEERLAAHDVDVDAGGVVVPVGVVERRLGAVLLRHLVLLGGEPLAQLGVARLRRRGHGCVSSDCDGDRRGEQRDRAERGRGMDAADRQGFDCAFVGWSSSWRAGTVTATDAGVSRSLILAMASPASCSRCGSEVRARRSSSFGTVAASPISPRAKTAVPSIAGSSWFRNSVIG